MTRTMITTHLRETLGDTHTPVGLYHKVRDHFPESALLESSDYHRSDESYSIIACGTLARFTLDASGELHVQDYGLGLPTLPEDQPLRDRLSHLIAAPQLEQPASTERFNGWLGMTGFEAAAFFDYRQPKLPPGELPLMRYAFFRHLIIFDHFRSRLMVVENVPYGSQPEGEIIGRLLLDRSFVQNGFQLVGEESASTSPHEFLRLVEKAKAHCQRGDVFQLVLSRRFEQAFLGDDLAVYRALRSVNPSPYLFHFDFADFRIFGSSPEAQLLIEHGKAQIHPIAGTFPRTGDDVADYQMAERLAEDAKENAEHVMLVDLARNDLSRHCRSVAVQSFREVQFFSHVIHLVSVVEGTLAEGTAPFEVFADTFPAGTLSGAPKHKALQLIDAYEPHARDCYGGAIGLFTPGGRIQHAITIRSFLSINGALRFQAGAGIVTDSVPEKELQEVNHKLAALRRALEAATTLVS